MTKIFGHRGAAGSYPENTMISFIEAERVNADGIELDVHLTKDGEVVVIHDETLERTTTGIGYVKDYTLKEIRLLDASYKFPDYGVCQVPSLDEVFNWALSNRLVINVELKNSKIVYEGLEEKVIRLIRTYHYENRVILSSFNHQSLEKCKKLAPDIEVAVLYHEKKKDPWLYAKNLGAESIHPNFRVISSSTINMTQENGIAVRPYTVNKQKEIERLLSVGCAAIITDFPERAIALIKQYKKQK